MICCGHDEDKNHGEPLKFDKNFRGPVSKRSCTDVVFLFIFIASLIGWIYISIWAMKNGDLNSLIGAKDSENRKCGIDEPVAKKSFLIFFNIVKCIEPTSWLSGCKTSQICVEQCPNSSFMYNHKKCDSSKINVIKSQLICKLNVNITDIKSCEQISELVNKEHCIQWYLESTSYLKRCVPKNLKTIIDLADKNSMNITDIIQGTDPEKVKKAIDYVTILLKMGPRIIEDVKKISIHIAIAFLIAIVACIVLIVIMRLIVNSLIWLSIFGIIGMLFLGIYYCVRRFIYLRYRSSSAESFDLFVDLLERDSSNTWLILGIILTFILSIVFLLVLVFRKRIVIAIALIKEASKALTSIKSTIFFAIFLWIVQIGIIAFASRIGLNLASVEPSVNQIVRMSNETSCRCTGPADNYNDGVLCNPTDFEDNCQMCGSAACISRKDKYSNFITHFQMFNLFGFFWTIFFITAFGEIVLAHTFATWYWTIHKSKVPFFTLTAGVQRIVRYHLGTVAFGSLVITIFRMIRFFLEFIDKKLKKWDNGYAGWFLLFLKCIFDCLEKILRFLSENAYIMCAIHGKPFCSSARDAFFLIMRNILRVIVLNRITVILFVFSKIFATLGMGAITYICFANGMIGIKLHYVHVPVALVMIGTYFIASVFFSVYSMAIDTLFLCFLEDCEQNDGSQEKPYFMSKHLMKILGKNRSNSSRI